MAARRNRLGIGVVLLAMAGAGVVAQAHADGFKPYYDSLDRDRVYMREGPTYDHPILWVYRRKGLPVKVVNAYDAWRKVQDSDGTVGWIHNSMLSDTREAVVTGKQNAPVRSGRSETDSVIALAQPGAVLRLKSCTGFECEVIAKDITGWIDKKDIWGVDPGETF